jgi:predicted nucleic acid-binding protein
MITAVDTSVLLDVFDKDPEFMSRSLTALRACEAEGALVACEIVWAEVASRFPSSDVARSIMERVRIDFGVADIDTALSAGTVWREYRRRGGPRTRIVADFLIGAHALHHADRLLTRDRGFYRSYFKKLAILDPTAVR